jgi:hypothetical protein
MYAPYLARAQQVVCLTPGRFDGGRLMTVVALVQGTYFVFTGIWSLVDIDSFQKVTGPKTDVWLVKTVGVLVIAIGSGLIVAGMQEQVSPEIAVIATASAAGLLGIELVYVFKRVIAPIYAVDAVVEMGLLGWWAARLFG